MSQRGEWCVGQASGLIHQNFSKPEYGCLAVTHDANDKRRNPGLQKQHGAGKTDGLFEELVIRSAACCKQANPHCEQSETADSYRSRSDHAATLMLKRYGDNVNEESAARADEFAAKDDHDGAAA